MYIMECVISNVAAACKLPVHKVELKVISAVVYTTFYQVRELNLYRDGDRIPANQVLSGFNLRRCWNELLTKIKYEERTAAVEDFNKLARVCLLVLILTGVMYVGTIAGRNEVFQ